MSFDSSDILPLSDHTYPIALVADVCSVGDGAHSKVNRVAEGIPYLTSKNIGIGALKLDKFDRISVADYERLFPQKSKATRRPMVGDVLIGIIGTFGNAYLYNQGDNFGVASSIGILRPDQKRLNPKFLYYVITSSKFRATHSSHNAGSAQGYTNIAALKKLSLPLPPLLQQEQIAALLGALDDRIALLRETNATLEAIAQALFKSWFVDFDPVRAKQEGRVPEGMDEAMAALFPDGFEESDLGAVPMGWRFESIEQVVEGVYDGPHATPPEANAGPIFLGIKNLTGTGLDLNEVRHIHEDQWTQWTRRVVPRHGDIVFSYEATLGLFSLIPPSIRCCLGRRLALIRPFATNGCGHFWFHQFVAPPFQRLLAKHTIQGATVNRIALKHFPSYTVLNPPDAIKLAFEVLVGPIWTKIHENQAHFRSLVSIRDTLLPRLISGQLRLQDGGDILEKAA